MSRFWLFVHLLGFTMWLGGGLAAMMAGIAAKRESRTGLAAVVRAQSAVYRIVIGPGALLAVLSGLILTLGAGTSGLGDQYGMNVWLMIMQGAGLIGALLVLFIAVPVSARLVRVEAEGQGAGYFDELRNRLRVVGMVHGTLALLALVAGAMVR
ncbi:MAG TPA: hypothetical protein VFK09_08535 [Gemmatimonadales bacterium]|jgi:hypothetical protein|nr:hypothetical protein [Gemmatimonadales bacterium]